MSAAAGARYRPRPFPLSSHGATSRDRQLRPVCECGGFAKVEIRSLPQPKRTLQMRRSWG